MTVRFKCQSEYQKSYGASRSRSVSPQRCAPLAGLRSDQMGVSREPGLQRRKGLSAGGLTQSCTSLVSVSDPRHALTEPTAHAHRKMPSAISRSRSVHRKKPQLDPKPSTHPDSISQTEPQTPAGPRPAAGPEPPVVPQADVDPVYPVRPQAAADHKPSADPGAAQKSMKPHSSQPDSQSPPSRPLTTAPNGQQSSANQVDHALRWKSGSKGQRSGGHKSEYHRQFSRKNRITSASPILTAEQVLYSSSRAVPPFKKNPVPMETEYQRSFQGLVPPAGPRLRKHVEHQRVPLFHTYMTNRRKRLDSQKKLHPRQDMQRDSSGSPPPPAQVPRRHRMLTEYESSFRSPLYRIPEDGEARDGDGPQVKELREKASLYRHQAWGTNFSRDHLGQLHSEHNALWEPTDTSDSATDPPTPCLAIDLCQDSDSRGTSCVEALDLASCSSNVSRRASVVGSVDNNPPHSTQIKAQTPSSPVRNKASGEDEEDNKEDTENTDGEEGRLPTPRLKMRPVQRTHHDLTTPATGGAILVGKVRSSGETSPCKQQGCGSPGSVGGGADSMAAASIKRREAWSDDNPLQPSSASPDPKPASKPTRTKASYQVAPPSVMSPPLHVIQGTLRHPDFQHNGELGLRLRELQCSGGGCGSDEDDRLSVMSWRSAATCSMASAVLERAQKRRENFWGKR
ncbi:nuclear protein MDM1 isoform X4 [Channa argus]|uniref:nuclear protein MDM1 isoform X4 n=1 Tax=Channa argus TaxID=215402 RepID=UPI003520FDAC